MSNRGEEPRIPVEDHQTKLTLAVRLVDAYTGELPITEYEHRPAATDHEQQRAKGRRNRTRYPRISLEGIETDPILNRSGFYLFLDVDIPNDSILSIDGGSRYLDEQLPADPTALDSLRLTEESDDQPTPQYQEIQLRPSPAYRFPPGATLLRGHVRNAAGNGVVGATVTVVGLDRTTTTVGDGEFVFYFEDPTADDIKVEGGVTMVLVDGEPPQIRVDGKAPRIEPGHDSSDNESAPLIIEEGATQSYILRHEGAE